MRVLGLRAAKLVTEGYFWEKRLEAFKIVFRNLRMKENFCGVKIHEARV